MKLLSRSHDEKQSECFVCSAKSDSAGLSLIQCQTAFSRITLGEKLQEVLGAKYLVLISLKDTICWDCATFLNWIDRFEHKINLMKEHFFDHIHTKYKMKEVCLEEGSATLPEETPVPVKPAVPAGEPAPRVKHVHFQESKAEKISPRGGPRKKEFSCKYCGKEYVSLVSLTMHVQRSHGTEGERECRECGARCESKAVLKRHLRLAHPASAKELTCVSCGFSTTNTEVYCRHVCNSSVVSLTCISCHKRYVDSNFRDVKGAYKCQSCQRGSDWAEGGEESGGEERTEGVVAEGGGEEEVPVAESAEVAQDHMAEEPTPEDPSHQPDSEEPAIDQSPPTSPQPEEMVSGDLESGMPEFLEEPVRNESNRRIRKEDQNSYLRCEGCSGQFKLKNLTQHACLIRGDAVEFVEVEPPVPGKKTPPPPPPPLLICKACDFQFTNIESLRNHWDETGHLREVQTPIVEINKIKDKFKKTEATFKVVKQNFCIRALIPGKNEEALRSGDDYKDMFVRISDNKTDPIEDFVKKSGDSCGTCGTTFPSATLLEEHQRNECLTCVSCGISFYDNALLKKHYLYTGHASKLRATGSSPPPKADSEEPNTNAFGYKCHLCVKTFGSRFLLRKHFLAHYKGTEKDACQFCLLEFSNKNDMQQHLLEVHGAHLYKCSYCERTFMSELFRNRHESKHKNIKSQIACSACNLKFNSQKSFQLHKDTYHRGNSCRLCSKVIEDPLALRRHERRHYFDKELECDLCKKHFRNKASLLAHSKQHSPEEANYRCESCPLGFLSDKSLKDHRLTHSTKKRFKCSRCSATFSSRAHYWTHTKMHDNLYPCSVCNRAFRDSSLLAIHRRKHWRVRPYQCPQCARVFSVSSTLLRHLFVHSRQYPHRCGVCKKGFLTRHAYHRHIETTHAVPTGFQPTHSRANIPSLPLNATDEDIFQAADTLISDDTIMFHEFPNKGMEQAASTDLITNEVVVETTELFDEILH